ncbi:GMC family oxidoreductase [Pseudooceanicola sp. CBS1P-1]|uniref:GMC family oxidoreductase n=1 Tax=Pseudooceanicola albus TaxID=2692189 RepID=A0A6L7G663_9RHOB|nr:MULTISPECIES: GMC family oxidoreductase [Pseudooceanicola]MBT9386164.1 GMC family oxidoreductase [Pseudooceanicola endophyticus]MXN19419.1 GMC family oxidoreductase [Pseudooceanicola albus]
MARQEKKKDVVIVGLGWTGSIAGIELAREGLEIVALERGRDQNTVPEFKYPNQIDELKYGVRLENMQKPAQQTVTVRRNGDETALPYRHLGSFLPGNGVGGAGTHWNGLFWRPQAEEMRLRSYVKENWGEGIIPEGMNLGDYPVSYEEMEPYFAHFEKVAGISGQAGNVNGEIREGGNPFEAPRSTEYPMPPMARTYDSAKFHDACKAAGYHPFQAPAGIASTSYVNPYGMQMGPCNYCGFCERYGCYQYSKSSPQTTILDALKRMPNFEYRTHSEVLKVELAADGKTATGVTYWDEAAQEEVFQPADMVILSSYQLNNVHLMLVSGLAAPYDPATGEGVLGKNYAYQMTGGVSLYYRDANFNPFVGTGANGVCIDDFSVNQNDFGKLGFIGGAYWRSGTFNGQPIRSMSLPPGTPSWGAGWKEGIGEWYGHAMSIGAHGSHMSYANNHLDLDPTYRDRHGRPLMRMTFNWQDNDLRMIQYMKTQMEPLAATMQADITKSSFKDIGAQYDVRPYQTTHNTGGHIMSENAREGVVNKYCQSWGQHNVFVMGAGNFVQNTQYNPTGLVGGLAYHTVDAIRTQYLSNPRPLV